MAKATKVLKRFGIEAAGFTADALKDYGKDRLGERILGWSHELWATAETPPSETPATETAPTAAKTPVSAAPSARITNTAGLGPLDDPEYRKLKLLFSEAEKLSIEVWQLPADKLDAAVLLAHLAQHHFVSASNVYGTARGRIGEDPDFRAAFKHGQTAIDDMRLAIQAFHGGPEATSPERARLLVHEIFQISSRVKSTLDMLERGVRIG